MHQPKAGFVVKGVGSRFPLYIRLSSTAMASSQSTIQRRNTRIESYLHLVQPIARHYARVCPESRDDLNQVGLLGLIRAAERYRSAEKVPFAVFARPHIRGAILHYLRDQAPAIRQPRRQQELTHQLSQHRQRLLIELGREPRDNELRAACGLSLQRWQQLLQMPKARMVSLDDETDLAAPGNPLSCERHYDELLQAVKRLDQQARQAIQEVVMGGQSLRQVAGRWQVSPSTVHRHLHRGLAELRTLLSPPSASAAC
jgi:RNA polymerase sigma-B factor